jgi:hypothetical protein
MTSRVGTVIVGVLLVAGAAAAADGGVVLEIGFGDITPSGSSSASWGWWDPGKYDTWRVDEDGELGLTDARVLVAGGEYTVLLAGERYPTLAADGEFSDPDTGDRVVQSLELKSAIFDLGLGRWLGPDRRNGAMPWIGVSYLTITEKRRTADTDLVERADSDLWGVVVGADASITVWKSVDVVGRALFRWARGTRTADQATPDPAGGSQGGTAEVSDSIDHSMWGLDLGLRWNATSRVGVEAGWRLRDRTLDGGPATFSGPQVKASITF